MIYTVTMNTAVDYYMNFDAINIGGLNRAKKCKVDFGGKGINVSMRLKELGKESVALGFIGGFTGEALKKYMDDKGIRNEFVNVSEGMTRINVKLTADKETELNGTGLKVSSEERAELLMNLEKIDSEDIVVLSGSAPEGGDLYEDICALALSRGACIAVDTTGDRLIDVLKYKPLVIKPNLSELRELNLGDDCRTAMKRLQDMGAKNVIVSMGEKGAAMLDDEGCYYTADALEGNVVTTVGCGDCMLAAFLAYRNKYRGQELIERCVKSASKAAFGESIVL